jgi:hypothetical protein
MVYKIQLQTVEIISLNNNKRGTKTIMIIKW